MLFLDTMSFSVAKNMHYLKKWRQFRETQTQNAKCYNLLLSLSDSIKVSFLNCESALKSEMSKKICPFEQLSK